VMVEQDQDAMTNVSRYLITFFTTRHLPSTASHGPYAWFSIVSTAFDCGLDGMNTDADVAPASRLVRFLLVCALLTIKLIFPC